MLIVVHAIFASQLNNLNKLSTSKRFLFLKTTYDFLDMAKIIFDQKNNDLRHKERVMIVSVIYDYRYLKK